MKRKSILQPILSLLLMFLLVLTLCGGALAAGGDGSGGGSGDGSGQTPVVETPVETSVETPTDTTTDPGTGDGTGGGKEEPLALASANPDLTAGNIPVDSPLTLEFNKNIAYVTVRDGNLKAFTLWEGSAQVPAEVTMADDQLKPDLRNFVIITPKEPLKEGTDYTVKVDNTLVAKSGAVLAAPLEMTFTAGAPSVDSASDSNTILLIGLGILAIVVIAVVIVMLKRKKA